MWPLILVAAALCGCRHNIKNTGAPPVHEPPIAQNSPTSEMRAEPVAVAPAATVQPSVPEPEPAPVDLLKTLSELNERLRDAFFDYDQFGIREDALAALHEDAAFLKPVLARFPDLKVTIEGHCDERGSAEYNLGLGDRRARTAAEALAEVGIPLDRTATISYGREMPQCADLAEWCYQRNRRAHLVVKQ